ncbi:hypothetical protein ES702_03184 [subsurface metagenome]
MVLKEVVSDMIKEVLVDTSAESEAISSDSIASVSGDLSLWRAVGNAVTKA